MQLDDRSGKLKSVESFWLLAGTASRTWLVVAMLGQSVTASQLRGLDAALLDRRGR